MKQKNQWMTDDEKQNKIIALNEVRFDQWKNMVRASTGEELDKIIQLEIDKIAERIL